MELHLDLKVSTTDAALMGVGDIVAAVRRLGRAGRVFTIGDICLAVRSRRYLIAANFMKSLVDDGKAEDLGFVPVVLQAPKTRQYRLLNPEVLAEPKPTRTERVQQQIWNILRGKSGREPLAIDDVVMLASTAAVPVSASQAGTYLNALVDGGYVVADTKHRPKTYRFLRGKDTGPLAPSYLRTSLTFDRNKHLLATPSTVATEVPL